MNTNNLGYLLETRGQDRLNNFTLLRLIAALLVIYGHSFALANPCAGCFDAVSRYLGYMYSGDLGLHVFFVISGFLVTYSMDRSGDLRRFLVFRALRIYPALVMFVLLVALVVGPLLTSESLAAYFASDELRQFVQINGTATGYYPYLPGVVTESRFPNTLAGTLWTLWIEVHLYLLVAMFGCLGLLKSRWVANTAILALVVLGIIDPASVPLMGGNPQNVRLAAFFAAGALFYVNRHSIPMRVDVLVLLVLFTWIMRDRPEYDLYFGMLTIYGTLFLAFARKLHLPKGFEDYSYGIYLYGWVIQQLLFVLVPGIGPYKMALLAFPLSMAAGALSWHLLEKRALGWRHRGPKPGPAAATGVQN